MKKSSLFSIIFQISGLFISLIASIVIISWYIPSGNIYPLLFKFNAMQFNTAVSLLLVGITLFLINYRHIYTLFLSRIFVIISFTIALSTFFQYFFPDKSFINYILFHILPNHAFSYIRPISFHSSSALAFASFILGIISFSNHYSPKKIFVICLLGSFIVALGIVPLLGYIIHLKTAYTWGISKMAIHTAICLTLLGMNIIFYAQCQTADLSLILPTSAFISMIVVTFLISLAIKDQEELNFMQMMQAENTYITTSLQTYQNALYAAIEHMRKQWEIQNGTPYDWWKEDAKAHLENYSSIKFLARINSQAKVEWELTSPTFNPTSRNLLKNNINLITSQTLTKLSQTKKSIITPVFQPLSGFRGFFYISPLFIKSDFDGALIAAIDISHLIDFLFAKKLTHDFFLSIYENNRLMFTNVDKYSGELTKWQTTNYVVNQDSPWKIILTPRPRLIKEEFSNIPFIINMLGVAGAFISALAIFFSIQLKRSEKILSISEKRLQAIMTASNFSIITTNLDGTIELFNRAAKRMLGYTAEEVIGKCTPLIFHDELEIKERTQKLITELNHVIKPGFETFITKLNDADVDEQEWTYIHKDGTRFPVWLSVSALRDEKDNITGYVGIAQDISERKAIDQMKNEFISIVSHELRTPLTSIRGSLGLILGGACGELNEKIEKMLNIAHNNCERLIRLINDILDVEKIETGKMEFHWSCVEINQLTQETVLANKGFAEKFNVNLIFVPYRKPLFVHVDSDRLTQVITNLISNAVKFSPATSEVEINITAHNGKVKLAVRDQGAGIPLEFQSKIFGKFAQADSSAIRKQSGTGLGLSICKAIMEQLSGTIGFKTSKEGTTFFINLPCVNLPPEKKLINKPLISVTSSSILHIEDDIDISTFIEQLVDKSAEIAIARSIQQAKDMLSQYTFKLAIIDLKLADGSGLDLIKKFYEMHIPCIIFSAYELPIEFKKYVNYQFIKSKTSNEELKLAIFELLNLNKDK